MAKLEKWSVSKLKCYQDCPYKFYCNHVLKMYQVDNQKALTWGCTFHETAEYLYSDFSYPNKERFLDFYKKHWISNQYVKGWNKLKAINPHATSWNFLGYQSFNEEQEYYQLGERIVSEFWNKHTKTKILPFATELKFEEKLPTGDILTGSIDKVDLIKRLFYIIDYKTGKWESSPEKLKEDLQLGLYQWAFCKKYNIPYSSVEYTALYYVRSFNLVPVTFYYKDIEKMLNVTTAIIMKVDSDLFPKKPRENFLCKNCQYKNNPCDSPRA